MKMLAILPNGIRMPAPNFSNHALLQQKDIHMKIICDVFETFVTISSHISACCWSVALVPFPPSDLKTALVERDDFSSGTSSRSTKLIHGGVRYLQKAIVKLDCEQVNASFFLCSWHLSGEFLVRLVILLYLPSVIIFHSEEVLTCSLWVTACDFLKLFQRIPTIWKERKE